MSHRNPRVSPLHRISAPVKLAGVLGFLVAVALMPRRPDVVYFIPLVLVAAFWILGGMSWRFAAKRLLVAEPLILGIGVLTLIHPESSSVFLAAIIKSHLCLLAMLALAWTTPFHEILQVMRRMRVPGPMLTTLALLVRYLPVLAEESARMQRARASRTFQQGRRQTWRNMAGIGADLFLRTADRAERIYMAMCARGWK